MHRLIVVSFVLIATSTRAEDDKPSTKVEGKFVIPKDVGSFEGRTVEIRLYKYDPRIADKAADLVEKLEYKKFSHVVGKETSKAFTIGAAGTLEPKLGYYVTFFILDGGTRTHIGKCEHDKNGIGKVLTDGNPSRIAVGVVEIKR